MRWIAALRLTGGKYLTWQGQVTVRLDQIIQIALPDTAAIEAILSRYCGLDMPSKELSKLAERLVGRSPKAGIGLMLGVNRSVAFASASVARNLVKPHEQRQQKTSAHGK